MSITADFNCIEIYNIAILTTTVQSGVYVSVATLQNRKNSGFHLWGPCTSAAHTHLYPCHPCLPWWIFLLSVRCIWAAAALCRGGWVTPGCISCRLPTWCGSLPWLEWLLPSDEREREPQGSSGEFTGETESGWSKPCQWGCGSLPITCS